jgi:hypothetical protein
VEGDAQVKDLLYLVLDYSYSIVHGFDLTYTGVYDRRVCVFG